MKATNRNTRRFSTIRLNPVSRNVFPVFLAALALLFSISVPQDSFAKNTSKKKKMTVNVEENANCPYGVSMADDSWGSNHICAPNYPAGASDTLRSFIGQRIEVEAQFIFSGDPKNSPPDGASKLIRIAGKKVFDPCPTSLLILTGINAGLSNTTPTLPPGCGGDSQ
jgi:hypothetical protein